MDKNKEWMSRGNIGCTFAALFAKNPECIGWKTVNIWWISQRLEIPKDKKYFFKETCIFL